MKTTNWKRKTLTSLVAGGVVAATPGLAGAQTTLDMSTGLGNGQGIPDSYGDNAVGTPNIGVTWNTAGDATETDGWDSYNNWDGRGDVAQTDFNQADPLPLTLTPEAGFSVYLESFELDEYAGGGNSVVDWTLSDSSGALFSGTWDDYSDANGLDGGRSLVTTGMNPGNAVFDNLTLSLDFISGTTSYLAMDNLTFGQVGNAVPEPGSAALLSLGLGAMLLRRRKED